MGDSSSKTPPASGLKFFRVGGPRERLVGAIERGPECVNGDVESPDAALLVKVYTIECSDGGKFAQQEDRLRQRHTS